MESIDILTGQHVTIKYEPASLLSRIGAALLDYFFRISYIIALLYTMDALGVFRNMFSETIIYTIVILLVVLPVVGYHLIFEILFGGQSLGKMIVKIKVTHIDGSIPGMGSYFLRWILRLIDTTIFWGGIGSLSILFTPYHQRLGDLAAGTIVIRTNPSLHWTLDDSFYDFPDNYEPTFTNVTQLSEGQVTFIINLLTEPKNRDAINVSILELTNKVKEVLNIENVQSRYTWNNRLFLETIVRDYNYYALLEI
jgi:uncharacterized RDD family membrane protein YckC